MTTSTYVVSLIMGRHIHYYSKTNAWMKEIGRPCERYCQRWCPLRPKWLLIELPIKSKIISNQKLYGFLWHLDHTSSIFCTFLEFRTTCSLYHSNFSTRLRSKLIRFKCGGYTVFTRHSKGFLFLSFFLFILKFLVLFPRF